jgi:prevent-host-death family protein
LIYEEVIMTKAEVNVAEAKKHFSDLLGRVAYGRERITILKRGKPMAVMVHPLDLQRLDHLSQVEGWLESDDPFFEVIDQIVRARAEHTSRISE